MSIAPRLPQRGYRIRIKTGRCAGTGTEQCRVKIIRLSQRNEAAPAVRSRNRDRGRPRTTAQDRSHQIRLHRLNRDVRFEDLP